MQMVDWAISARTLGRVETHVAQTLEPHTSADGANRVRCRGDKRCSNDALAVPEPFQN